MNFLSERNLELHKEYLNTLKLKLRIFEKSYPEVVANGIHKLYRSNIPSAERDVYVRIFSEIKAHELYFTSFSDNKKSSERIKKEFGSQNEFLYEIYKRALECDGGFLFVCDREKSLQLFCGNDYVKTIASGTPILALDLCEHAYFLDYGFDKDRYLISCLSYLNLTKITS